MHSLPRAALLLAAAGLSAAAQAELSMPSVFNDHMVLQRDTAIPVYGRDTPGQAVTVTFAGQTQSATADAAGRWRVNLAPVGAGGPYTLTVAGSDKKEFLDVLTGDIWVCSGQSNMQFMVSGAINAPAEIAAANHPQIRLLGLPQVRNGLPQEDVSAAWTVCTPQSVRGFSAVGYFFGRDLNRELNVPIGLINSSWGGTAVEAWTPRETLITFPGMKEALGGAGEDQAEIWKKHAAALNRWLADIGVNNEPGAKFAEGFASPGFNDTGWPIMNQPTLWGDAGITFNGVLWFRKSFDLPADFAGGPATLDLGAIDDLDCTFVNGKLVGRTHVDTPSFWVAQRRYLVPAGLLKPGRNVIAVRVADIGGGGGMTGPADVIRLKIAGLTLPLSGAWRYAVESRLVVPADKPRPPEPGGNLMATELYNAMIHPLIPYAIRGVIWYQGCSNAGNPALYRELLPAMIQSWRQRWGSDFTFLIVQLAGFMTDSGDPADNPGWAVFRDVQRQIAEQTPNCGLALAIDIGDPADIHPRNKQDVGKRLALQALQKSYGKTVAASGPTFKSLAADGGKLMVAFDHLGGGLKAKDNSLANNFAIQGQDGKWAWADAALDGDRVVLSSPAVAHPVAVRYAWQNSPKASLYNQAGLPAVPFEASIP
ncbi:MAG: sialate O-acetylesterase [Lentisphaeria bacterium]